MAKARFAAPLPACLLTIELDGLTAVYHRSSGMTHLLAEPMPQILDALRDGALTIDDLLMQLGLDTDDTALAALTARLQEMEASGLVERL